MQMQGDAILGRVLDLNTIIWHDCPLGRYLDDMVAQYGKDDLSGFVPDRCVGRERRFRLSGGYERETPGEPGVEGWLTVLLEILGGSYPKNPNDSAAAGGSRGISETDHPGGAMRLGRPRIRDAGRLGFESRILGKGVARTHALESLVISGFLRGLSTRDVQATLEEVLRSRSRPTAPSRGSARYP